MLDIGAKIIERFIPDPAAKAAAQAALSAAQQSGELQIMLGQIQVDALEAASTSWFVAGWRPFVGWICGLGMGYQFLFYPLAIAFLPKIVSIDTTILLPILGGLIGLRTLEKHNGVDTK